MKLSIIVLSCLSISSTVDAEEDDPCPSSDDWSFRVDGQNGRGCGWVGRYPNERCLVSTGAKEACGKTCCGLDDSMPPVTSPPPPPPPPPPPLPPVFMSAAPLYNQYDVCTDFCKAALTTCEGVVDWVTETYAVPHSRHLDGGAGTDATGKPSEQFDACHDTCMGWVYWRQDVVSDPLQRWSQAYWTGDSLNCRYTNLGLAAFFTPNGIETSETTTAANHCQHLTNDGGWMCTDYRNADNKTPSQLYKDAMFTKHRKGDCWLAGDDKIADCHRKGLTDDTIDQNLLWLPDDVHYIFLQLNALKKVPDLSRFTELKGIYLESNAIDTLNSDDFASNTKLEILNVKNNFIVDFPGDVLALLTDLKAVDLSYNYMTSIPATTFENNQDLEMINMINCQLTGFEAGTFDGLMSLKLLLFGGQGKYFSQGSIFDETGIPDGLFDDLISLEKLSTFVSSVGTLKNDWFGDWSANLEDLDISLYQNPLLPPKDPFSIEDGVFDKLPSLITLTGYNIAYNINPIDVANNPHLKTVTYASPLNMLAPLPEPALFKEDLIAAPQSELTCKEMYGNENSMTSTIDDFSVSEIEEAFNLEAGSLTTRADIETFSCFEENYALARYEEIPLVFDGFELLESTPRSFGISGIVPLTLPTLEISSDHYLTENFVLGCAYTPKPAETASFINDVMQLSPLCAEPSIAIHIWDIMAFIDDFNMLMRFTSSWGPFEKNYITHYSIFSVDPESVTDTSFTLSVEGPTGGAYEGYVSVPADLADTIDAYGAAGLVQANMGKWSANMKLLDFSEDCPDQYCKNYINIPPGIDEYFPAGLTLPNPNHPEWPLILQGDAKCDIWEKAYGCPGY